MRIEDVDEGRTQVGATESIIAALRAYGLLWDGEIKIQSARKNLYENALAQLTTCGAVFACKCTRKQLETAPLNRAGERFYPGNCRDLGLALTDTRAVRVRVRVADAVIEWVDAHFGIQSESMPRDVGDFVIKRADGLFAYQLAVVVDDAAQGVTHVVRGADLLSSTARQIYLQRLLGLPTPHYLHVPVVVNGAGEKLSKQTRAPSLEMGDAILPTLRRAWNALGQPAMADNFEAPTQFLARAAQQWQITNLPRTMSVS